MGYPNWLLAVGPARQVPQEGLKHFRIYTVDAAARRKDPVQPLRNGLLVPSTVLLGVTILSLEVQPSHKTPPSLDTHTPPVALQAPHLVGDDHRAGDHHNDNQPDQPQIRKYRHRITTPGE